jgi:hypothetical protein
MRIELPGIRYRRHDLTGCLHVTMAVLLGFHGLRPLEVLGAAWGFDYRPDRLRREEYYVPGGQDALLAALAPYHPLTSRWHTPADAAAGWREVRAAVAAGRPVAVAVDNYHLPFRPAYQDVHTNHLITVYGFDDERGTALVIDPVPPRFQGAIAIDALTAARDSGNPVEHGRDLFFTGAPIGNRWLEIEVTGEMPDFEPSWLREVTERNAAAFRADAPGGRYSGLAGQERFLLDIAERLAAGSTEAIDEAFLVAGPALAVTGMHAEWLAHAAREFDAPRLREAARHVDRVAHHWTAVRIIVGAARSDPASAAGTLRARARALVTDQMRALERIDRATADLPDPAAAL